MALVLAGSVGSGAGDDNRFRRIWPLDSGGTNGPGADRTSFGFFFDTPVDHSHVDGGAGGWSTSDGTKFMMVDNVGGA